MPTLLLNQTCRFLRIGRIKQILNRNTSLSIGKVFIYSLLAVIISIVLTFGFTIYFYSKYQADQTRTYSLVPNARIQNVFNQQTTLFYLVAMNESLEFQNRDSLTNQLNENTVSMAELLFPSNDSFRSEFILLWQNYYQNYLQYCSSKPNILKVGDSVSEMTKYPERFASFFGRVKVTAPVEELRLLFSEYINALKTVADASLVKDFSAAWENQQKANEITYQLTDLIINESLDNE